MKIAIIGSGGAGMASAYYLNKAGHDITVFEKEAMLGGHIRSVGKNVKSTQLAENLVLDTGVIEFPDMFHHFFSLMKELEVPLTKVDVGSGLFYKNGKKLLSDNLIVANYTGFKVIFEKLKLFTSKFFAIDVFLKLHRLNTTELASKPLGNFLKNNSPVHHWLQNLVMYCYSIPYHHISNFPTAIGIHSIKTYRNCNWYGIEGGVYQYIEQILKTFKGEIILNSKIEKVVRNTNNVEIYTDKVSVFDKVIFATSPGVIIQLLKDADEQEYKQFFPWKDQYIHTHLHSDATIYDKFNIKKASEFDFFQTNDGWGYNAFLNTLCGVKENIKYYLAYNLESIINPLKLLHKQKHLVPYYQMESFQFRDDIIRNNGHKNTYYVGAYLGNGLHEGAITSALKVVKMISDLKE